MWKIPKNLVTMHGSMPALASSRGAGRGFSPEGLPVNPTKRPHPDLVRDLDRINQCWFALAVAIATIYPTIFITGVNEETHEGSLVVGGLMQLYTWCFTCATQRGYRVFVNYIKCLKNWCLHYSLRNKSSPPEILPGLIGARDGVLTFPWARGPLSKIRAPQYLDINLVDSHALFQLYLVGKALPIPEPEKVERVLTQHHIDYSHDEHYPILEELAFGFSKEYAEFLMGLRGDVRSSLLSTHFGSSSSRTSSRGIGGKDLDAFTEVLPVWMGTTRVPWGQDSYSIFGELKVSAVLTQHLPLIAPGICEFPVRWLYLTRDEVESGVQNQVHIARDVALSRLTRKGYVDVGDVSGLIGSDKFLGVYQTPNGLGNRNEPLRLLRARTVEITVVTERGDKARPVNISDWEFTILGHIVRDYLYQSCKEDKEVPTFESLSGAGSFISQVKAHLMRQHNVGAKGLLGLDTQLALTALELLSLDLSRCSDLILGSLNRGFMRGFYYGSRARDSKLLQTIWMLNSDSRRIVYRDSDLSDITSDIGPPMMGDPPTWWVDNMYTKFASMLARDLLDKGISLSGARNPLELSVLLKRIGYVPTWDFRPSLRVRCGDDEVALATPEANQAVIDIYPLIGGQVSLGTNVRSDHFGVYCEAHIVKGDCSSPNNVIGYVDILRIKSITKPDAPHNSEERDVPPLWTRGKAAQSSLGWWSASSEEYQLVSSVLHQELFDDINHAYSQGVQCYIDPALGGLGYPCKLEDAWRRSNLVTKGMIEALATYQPTGMDLEIMSVLSEQSSLFTVVVGGNPYYVEDSESILAITTQLGQNHGFMTKESLAALGGLNSTEYPCSHWKDFRNPFQVPQCGGRWLSFLEGSRIIRRRLIDNRGIVLPDRRSRIAPNSVLAARFSANCEKLVTLIRETGPPCDPGKAREELIPVALATANTVTRRVFVNMDIVDTMLPPRAKKIPCVL